MLSREKEVVSNPFGPPPDKLQPPEGDEGEDEQGFRGMLIKEETKVSNPFPNPVEQDV